MASGAVAVVALAGKVGAQDMAISGTVQFEGGAPIPPGEIKVFLDDPASPGQASRKAVEARVASHGKSASADFSLAVAQGFAPAGPVEVVATLERADGWLLARGSASAEVGKPVVITLNTVMY